MPCNKVAVIVRISAKNKNVADVRSKFRSEELRMSNNILRVREARLNYDNWQRLVISLRDVYPVRYTTVTYTWPGEKRLSRDNVVMLNRKLV